MTRPILYSFRRCPYAMRARMAVLSAGVSVELREVLLRKKPPEMLAASPKGTVPVLCLADGRVIDESRDVMDWALASADPQALLRHQDTALINCIDSEFKFHLDRYKYATRYAGADAHAHRDAACAILKDIEVRLQNAWLAGAAPAYTDLAILPFIRQFRIADPDFFDHEMGLPRVRDWVQQFLVLPLFEDVMHKYTLWQPGDAPTIFGATTEKEII